MKIALVGGIYGKGGSRSGYIKVTPETTLENGFRNAGHQVTALSHYDDVDFSAFDVVHVHHLSYGAVRLASDASRTPFVFTNHDASHLCGAPLSLPRRLAIRYVLSRADGIVSLSRAEADFQTRTYLLPSTQPVVIPNGIDPLQFPLLRRNGNGQSQPWRLLFVGQLIPLKNCDIILRAMARLSHTVELTLAYQNDALEATLRALATSLNIADQVRFLGRQTPSELARLYQVSDLLILPSETEALPSVITEAMLSGLPFVASAVGGVPEQAGGFGYLLAQRTEEHLAEAIGSVLDRYAKFRGASESMSRYAQTTFSLSSMLNSHLELYRTLPSIARRRSGNRLVRAAVRRWGCSGPPNQKSSPVIAARVSAKRS